MPKNEVRMLNGYRVVFNPSYHRAMTNENWKGYVYEHIVVAEEMLGRPLLDDEVTHHLNGNRSDNRSENILVLSRSQHSKLHSWLDAGAPFLKNNGCNGMNSGKSKISQEEVKYCAFCGITLQNTQEKFCSSECRSGNSRSSWPSADQLREDISSMSMSAVGRKYGISGNAVKKRAKSLGIL